MYVRRLFGKIKFITLLYNEKRITGANRTIDIEIRERVGGKPGTTGVST